MKERLLGKTPAELKEIAISVGLPSFAGGQIARWLYVSKVKDISEMTNISKAGRESLAERYEVGRTFPIGVQESTDGTKKYLFPAVREGEAVEAVMIPDGDRKTLCVSSQAGCRMGCKFCMTGRQGFHGNLTPADILSQFLSIDEAEDL
ncbi:MAG: 23S rRNA (adenine(2503)-C(2))-methyltransferase RlmN, partial [Bacteroidales bacterium]|nr:23S rRNA (adenine(2503)-C(2))-methyltransferase RlmN [Bacteroidales bacterium]